MTFDATENINKAIERQHTMKVRNPLYRPNILQYDELLETVILFNIL